MSGSNKAERAAERESWSSTTSDTNGQIAASASKSRNPLNKGANGGSLMKSHVFKPFPLQCVPAVVRQFVSEHARTICCDPTLVLLPVFAVMAIAIGNSRRVVVRKTWNEPCIVWPMPVADSGSGKSPAFDAAVKPINDLQRAAVTVYESEMKDYKADQLRYEQQQKARTPSPEPLEEPQMPVLSDVYLEDTTVEAIAPALIARPRGSGIVKEELSGWFLQLNTYKKSGGGDESFYLQSHGGRPSKVNRKTSPTLYVPATTLSITGTIQPVILRQVLTSSHIGSGMAARFLFAMPPEPPKRWIDDEVPDEVIRQYEQLILKLAALPMGSDNIGLPAPVYIGMAKSAQRRFIAYYDDLGANRPNIDKPEMRAALSKLEGGAVRLALIFSTARFVLGEKEREVVDEDDIANGVAVAKWFAHEAERIYGMLSETDEEKSDRELIGWLQARGGSAIPSELAQQKWGYRGKGAAEAALDRLVKRDAGSWGDIITTDKGGCPSRRFTLHPNSHQETPSSKLETEGSLMLMPKNEVEDEWEDVA